MQISGVLAEARLVLPSTTTVAGGGGGCKLSSEFNHFPSFSDSTKSLFSTRLKIGQDRHRTQRLEVGASGNSGGDLVRFAPLRLESPIGQFLEQTLQTNPHLLLAAIDQQLENLKNEKAAQKKEKLPPSPLYKRIAQVKQKERRKAVAEILYSIVVHKFIDNDISMIQKISTSDLTGRVDSWANQEQKLGSVHSPEAFEMIRTHLSGFGLLVVDPSDNILRISKIKLGKLYADSMMHGYFLKRVDQRYQLERSMDTLHGDTESCSLKSYVKYLDSDTRERYSTVRSKEAIFVIEKQTQALFGRPFLKVSEVVSPTHSGLLRLFLEAVTFGSFLWEAESYVMHSLDSFNANAE